MGSELILQKHSRPHSVSDYFTDLPTQVVIMDFIYRKTDCGRPSGGGIKSGHIRYPSYGGTHKKKSAMSFVSDTLLMCQRKLYSWTV